jgi:1-pyrroline-5-carboxylate dehydrogenase
MADLLSAGSKRVAEMLAENLRGKVYLEDAGFDWKILGPDVGDVDYVAWQCDQDAYACSGQKCSAQSLLFMHENWKKSDLLEKWKGRAAARKLDDLTVGPVLTMSTKDMLDHAKRLLKIPGAGIALSINDLVIMDMFELFSGKAGTESK